MTTLKRTKKRIKPDINLERMLEYGEVVKPIKLDGAENYFVSNMGRVFSGKFSTEYFLINNNTNRPDYVTIIWRELKQTTSKNGYKCVNLMLNKKRTKCYVHKLVFTAFKNSFVDTRVVIITHKDKNKTNNTIENLELKFKKKSEKDYRNHHSYVYKNNMYKSLNA